tara:strand:- start:1759 stop:2358 length:600 start_codon:yes stop_codon:yes gene_type:complete
MNKIFLTVFGATALFATFAAVAADAYPDVVNDPVFGPDGQLEQPQGFRRWVFIGSPLTPNALNDGSAGFPEFHNVYVEPAALDHYRATGAWPEGTVLVKELQLTAPGRDSDGSRVEASGRGYFPAALNGLDVSVKDSRRFADTNGWGFFNFGHHAPPYAATAAAAPREACVACHAAAGHEDMVFVNFYQHLRSVPAAAR